MENTPPYALQGVTPKEDELSDKQARILDFIQGFHAKNQRPPTNREIGRGVGIRSTSHVNYHLRILEEKGHSGHSYSRSDFKKRTVRAT